MRTTEDVFIKNIHKIVNDFFRMTMSNFLSMAFKFFSSLIIASILGPTNYGFWSVVELINRFSPLLTFGIPSGIKREIPYWKAREDGFNHQVIANNGLSGMIISTILIILTGILLSFYFSDSITKFAIITVSSAGAFTQLYIFLLSLTLAHKMFIVYSKIKIFEALFYFLITVLFTYYYNIHGMLVGSAVSPIVAIVLFFLITKYSISVDFDFKILKRIITVGMPIITVGMFYLALISINRIIILRYLSLEYVGYWGFAMLLFTLFSQLTGALGEILYTYMNEHLGTYQRVDNMDAISIFPSIILSLIMPIFIIITILILPYIVTFFFESYRQSIMTSQIILVSVSISYGGVNILSSYLKQKLLIIFLIVSICINTILTVYFLSNGLGIVWSAVGLVSGLAFYTICHTVASLVYMKKGLKYIFKLLSANIIYPGLIASSVLLIYNSYNISPSLVVIMILLPMIVPTFVMLMSYRKQVNPIQIVVSFLEN